MNDGPSKVAKQSLRLMCGFSASGKTTYVQKNFTKCVVISEELHRVLSSSNFCVEWKDFYRVIEEQIVKEALVRGISVVIDKTCMSKSRRKRWIRIAKEINVRRQDEVREEMIRIECCFFRSISYEEAIARNTSRDRTAKEIAEVKEAIEWQKREFQEPTYDEGFDDIHLL